MARRLEDLPAPNQSRIESYLGAIADQPGATIPDKPGCRMEEYLEYIAETGGGGQAKGIFVGYVSEGDIFPTTRPDGSELINEDFVRPDPNSEFPFTIGDVTFNTTKDTAIFMEGKWYPNPGALQATDETPLSKPEEEAFEETRANQYQLNKDILGQLKNAIIEYSDLDTVPSTKLYKRIYRQTEDTTSRIAGLYWYNADSTETDKWEKLGGDIESGNTLPSGKYVGQL